MNKAEYLAVQNAARAIAAEAVVEWLAGGMAGVLEQIPAGARSALLKVIRANVEATKIGYLRIAVKGMTPAESDLMAGEFQEAFAKITDDVLKRLGEQQ